MPTRINAGIERVKLYMALTIGENSISPVSVMKHCIGIAICKVLYGASIADYFELRLFRKKHSERKTYLTEKYARQFNSLVNGPENVWKFHDKIYMYQVLNRFIKREQLFCPPHSYAEFESFIRRHGTVLYKKSKSYWGTGVELWSVNGTDIDKLYNRSLNEPAVLDELVIQHPDIARLNPDSVNTVRIYTLMIKDTCHFIAAEFHIGRSGQVIDNYMKGGLAAGIDFETGALMGAGFDLRGNTYAVHPDTGADVVGFTIPNWSEVLRFTVECARACPLAIVEWDLAVRENDCVLIEANPNVGNSEIQMGEFHGRKKQFEELEKLYRQSLS